MENEIADEILTTEEAARLLKVGERTLARRRADSGLPAHRVGGRGIRFFKNELLAWLRDGPDAPAARLRVKGGGR